MTAYYILMHTITDLARYQGEYIPATGAILAKHQGELIAATLKSSAPAKTAVHTLVRYRNQTKTVKLLSLEPDGLKRS